MSHNKIVLVTIHQPSSKIFQMFSKVVLLDKGGRLVFFGTPTEALHLLRRSGKCHRAMAWTWKTA